MHLDIDAKHRDQGFKLLPPSEVISSLHVSDLYKQYHISKLKYHKKWKNKIDFFSWDIFWGLYVNKLEKCHFLVYHQKQTSQINSQNNYLKANSRYTCFSLSPAELT